MPKVFGADGYKFFSSQTKATHRSLAISMSARLAASPSSGWNLYVALASSDGFSSKELRTIEQLVKGHETQVKEAWDEFFD